MTAAHDTQALTEAEELLQWFDECEGFESGTAAPHKWVLQAHSELRRLNDIASRLQEQEGQPAPIAWEATTSAYIKFITQERYSRFAPAVQRWYKPYRCSSCATLVAGSQAVQVPGWRPTDDEIRQAWDDLQKREEAALQALRAARIGSTCAACGVGKLAADGNGYNYFERCDSCRHVPFYDENGVDMIAKLAKARAAAPLQPLAGGEVGNG